MSDDRINRDADPAPSEDVPPRIRGGVRGGGPPVEHQGGVAVEERRPPEGGEPVGPHGPVPPLLLGVEVVPSHLEEAAGDRRPPDGGHQVHLVGVGANDVHGHGGSVGVGGSGCLGAG